MKKYVSVCVYEREEAGMGFCLSIGGALQHRRHFCHILEVANLMYSQEAHQWLPEVGNAGWD